MRNEKGQFVKGFTPWNKGLKGFVNNHPNIKKNQFKKGNIPKSYKPIGSKRIAKDGYTYIKIADTRIKKNDWKLEHILLWEKHNGKVPANHVVFFKDGNKENLKIENLELLSRSELMSRNTIHRYPPELKEVIRLNNKLRRAINE